MPLLATNPGMVAADTKQYLYLDPGRLTVGAASMWDPNTGLGTVTHQNIGYLFPMGPFFTVVHWLGIPMWVGQRIWMGTLLFAAGTGVAYCCRQLGVEGWGRAVAAVSYTLSPYLIDYIARSSAIVLPWAALGWLVGLTVKAVRANPGSRWRYPACFALIVALVGGINATSIVLVLIAPALWLVYAIVATREITWKGAGSVAARIVGLSVLVSLWWIAGLWVEARHGINILRVTETIPTVSRTSSAAEVLRGLGYWYFYGQDKVQPWTLAGVEYTQSLWLLAVSFAVPAAAVALGLLVRWRYRAYAVLLVAVGVVIAVGAFPYAYPSVVGDAVKGASSGSTLAMAMRSSDRVVPLVVLGLSLMMGSGIAALAARWPARAAGARWSARRSVVKGWAAGAAAIACVCLVAAALPPLWSGNLVASNLDRPSQLPSYWQAAANSLNAGSSSTRVLGVPGEDFAAYSWGVTQDQVAPGLLTRPYVQRQVVPQGTSASANLLEAFDEQLQEGTLNPRAVGPFARLISAGDVLLQSDLQVERYHLPFPQQLWALLTAATGLGKPVGFGAPNPAKPIKYPLDTETRLGLATPVTQQPAVATFSVPGSRPIVRTEAAQAPVIIAGDGNGVVDMADAGLLDSGDPTLLYSASLDTKTWNQAMANGAQLVLTDTNQLAGEDWGSLRDNVGAVQQAGVPPLVNDPADYSLPVFPGETSDAQTVAQVGAEPPAPGEVRVASVRANAYGDSLTYTPEGQPINAFDGNPGTAWTFGAHAQPVGTYVEADLTAPVTTDHVVLHQLKPSKTQSKRQVTDVKLTFDGGQPVTAALTPASWSPAGQTVSFAARTFSRFDLQVTGATPVKAKVFDDTASLGFSEIQIPGVARATQTLRLPTDLLVRAGASSLPHPLTVLLTRSRVTSPPRSDPEPSMTRTFSLPTARTFAVGGGAEISAQDSDYLINQLIGLTPPGPLPPASDQPATAANPAVVVAANSSTRLDGDRQARANAAVDGNPNTAWVPETGPTQVGAWISYTLSRPITMDHLDLQVVNDGRHSLPTRLTISTDEGQQTVQVSAPPVGEGRPQGATSTVRVAFPALGGSKVKVTIDAIQPVTALDYYAAFSNRQDILPVGIAELGLQDVVQPAAPTNIPAVCQSGLLRIDGKPVDVEVTGTSADALSGQELTVTGCGNAADGVSLGPGTHTVQTSMRLPSGWAIDQLALSSAPGGGPASGPQQSQPAPQQSQLSAAGGPQQSQPAPQQSQPPAVTVDHQDRTSLTVTVRGDGQAEWLVLGQSYSAGWKATTASGHSLGPPTLIDGYANGWYIPAGSVNGATVVHLTWTPQRVVWIALGVSAAGLAVTVALIAVPGLPAAVAERLRRRRRRAAGAPIRPRAAWSDVGPETPRLITRQGLLSGPKLSVTAALVGALISGGLTAIVSRPVTGLIVGVATFAAGRLRWGRVILRGGAIAALVVLIGYAVVEQHRYRYLPTINWPANMSAANDIAWLAVCLLGADVVVGALRSGFWQRRAPRSVPTAARAPEPSGAAPGGVSTPAAAR